MARNPVTANRNGQKHLSTYDRNDLGGQRVPPIHDDADGAPATGPSSLELVASARSRFASAINAREYTRARGVVQALEDWEELSMWGGAEGCKREVKGWGACHCDIRNSDIWMVVPIMREDQAAQASIMHTLQAQGKTASRA
jgi:hypothetical protein